MTLIEIQVKADAHFKRCGYGDCESELLSIAYTARIALRKLKQFEQADYFGDVVNRRADLIVADEEIIDRYQGIRV